MSLNQALGGWCQTSLTPNLLTLAGASVRVARLRRFGLVFYTRDWGGWCQTSLTPKLLTLAGASVRVTRLRRFGLVFYTNHLARLGRFTGLAACLAVVFALSACTSNKPSECRRQACIEDIWVAQSDGLSKAGKGETLPITPGLVVEALPASQNVRLAVAREVPWSQVRALRKRILDAGKTPFLMVASDLKTGALQLYDELQAGTVIEVFVSVGGKLCVRPTGSLEAKCVKPGYGIHVDRAHTRELVREAVKAWGLHDVLVEVPPDLEWADVARAVDGARTCCLVDSSLADTQIRVRLR